MDIDSGVYLKTWEIHLYPTHLTHLLTGSSRHTRFPTSPVPTQEVDADPGNLGRKLYRYVSCCCLQVPVLGITSQGPWASPSIYVWAGLWSLGPFPTSQIFLPATLFTFYFLEHPSPFFFFPRPLLPFAKPSSAHHLFFPEPYTPSFPNLDSLGKEAQCMIGLLIGGTLSSLSLNWKIQDVTLLFSPGVIKIYSQPIRAAASK